MRFGQLILFVILPALIAAPAFSVVFENFDDTTGAIDWNGGPYGQPYYTDISVTAQGSAGNGLSITEKVDTSNKHSTNALVHGYVNPTLDWSAYTTLEFDARTSTSNFTGYSVRIRTLDGTIKYYRLFKSIPFTAANTFQHFKIDISGISDRNSITEILFYVNRTGQNAGQSLIVDNFEVTNNPVPAVPDELVIDDFDTYNVTTDMYMQYNAPGYADQPWNHVYQMGASLGSPGYLDSAHLGQLTLNAGGALSAYARRNSLVISQPPVDLADYKSILFDAKISRGSYAVRQPPAPIGFALTANAGGTTSYTLWYFPEAYDTWQTFSLDITNQGGLEQLINLLFYVNRCGINDFGQTLHIDNIRASKNPADIVEPLNPLIDDFESGDIRWWFYDSYYDINGTIYDGTSHALITDAATGQYALKIKNELTSDESGNDPQWAPYPHTRKTIHQNWTGYSTLSFDAKMANSTTSEGFTAVTINVNGAYSAFQFWPVNCWKRYRIDISALSRNEIIALGFGVNNVGDFGKFQSGHQELYVDNIRLSNEPVNESYATVGAAKAARGSGTVTINGAVVTGVLSGMYLDRTNPSPTNMRTVFFIEDTTSSSERASAIPVIWDTTAVAEGDKVNVTGLMLTDKGNRVIYATNVTPNGTDTPAGPLMVSGKDCAGLSTSNLETVGMLVTIAGRATAYKTDILGRKWLYIDDGSGVIADVVDSQQMHGVKVFDKDEAYAGYVGKYISATGYAMNDAEIAAEAPSFRLTGKYFRALWPKAELAADAVRVIAQ